MIPYRDPARLDSELLTDLARHFLDQGKELRKKHKYFFLSMDKYGANVCYSELYIVRENKIIAVSLPAHTNHRTQVLD